MTQYINKSALMAEIERIKKEECPTDTYEGRCKLLWFEQFLSFINTLEVKEVDLEKEVRNFLNDNYTSVEEPDEFLTTTMQIDDMTKFAEHFFVLGLNVNNSISPTTKDLIQRYVSDHGECRWLDASELEQLLNDFVLEYDIIKNREYEQQCKVSNDGK